MLLLLLLLLLLTGGASSCTTSSTTRRVLQTLLQRFLTRQLDPYSRILHRWLLAGSCVLLHHGFTNVYSTTVRATVGTESRFRFTVENLDGIGGDIVQRMGIQSDHRAHLFQLQQQIVRTHIPLPPGYTLWIMDWP
uniref:Putative secreted peptide n=1 Tax=Anopheles braziliensis TaxID=58242 RepID=A0A2M3ZPQ0_9DIPT